MSDGTAQQGQEPPPCQDHASAAHCAPLQKFRVSVMSGNIRLTRPDGCAAPCDITQLPRLSSTSEASAGSGISGGSVPPANLTAAHGRLPCLLLAPQAAVPSFRVVRCHASSIAPLSAPAPSAKLPTEQQQQQQQAASPRAAHAVQPVCIDLTLSDGDDEPGPRTPPLQQQGSCTVRALSAASCHTPVAFHSILDAAEQLRLARTQQQTGLAPRGSHTEAVMGRPAAAAATDCLASSCRMPSLQPAKRRAVGDGAERLAAALIGAGSASSDAETGDYRALDHAAHTRQPDPAEQAQPDLQLRCSRRVQKRAFDLLSARRSPLVVAYPLGGHVEQHYIESLDMTADLASALHIDKLLEAEHRSCKSRRDRRGHPRCGFMQRAAAAMRNASNTDVF